MKKYFIILLGALLFFGCNKGDSILDVDDTFSTPDTGDSGSDPDTDDPNYIKLNNLRTYVFAGQSNPSEENLLLSDNNSVQYNFESVFIPDGEIVEKENYSFEKPMAGFVDGNTILFFKRSLDGSSVKNIASGWCLTSSTIDGWSPILETRKYSPYGYEKNNAAAFGISDMKVFFASKGVLFSEVGSDSWSHFPEALQWSSRDLSDFNLDIGGNVLPNILSTKFGLMLQTESYNKTVEILEIAEIKYDTLDMDGEIPIYGTTPVDTVWAYTPSQSPQVQSLIISNDQGATWTDYVIQTTDTLHLHNGTTFAFNEGPYEGSIITIGYDLNRKKLNQAVYQYEQGHNVEDTLMFQCKATNITNDAPSGLSTPDIIFNPVTNRVEMVEGFKNKLILWSIGLDEIFSGSSDWTRECELINRGDRYADYADTYPVGSVVDIENGVQVLYLSMGAKSPSRKAIYSLTRDLNTTELANWLWTARTAAGN